MARAVLEEPVSLPVARAGIEQVEALAAAHASPAQVIAIETTGVCTGRGPRRSSAT